MHIHRGQGSIRLAQPESSPAPSPPEHILSSALHRSAPTVPELFAHENFGRWDDPDSHRRSVSQIPWTAGFEGRSMFQTRRIAWKGALGEERGRQSRRANRLDDKPTAPVPGS